VTAAPPSPPSWRERTRAGLAPHLFTRTSRAVAPLLPGCVWRMPSASGPAETRTLHLTFDDGPHPEDTPRLLDLLARHEARATFFLLGARVRERPDLARALAEAGHTLGQHTHSHPDPWRTPPARLAEELARATTEIEDATGRPVGWVRPPYGHLTRGLRRWAEEHRQRVALWDVMPGDFLPGAASAPLAALLVRYARPGSLVVLHEGGHASAVTSEALDLALPRLRQSGLRSAAL
jgi:peptidoglycan-N-acetylglucosamine deacetylase